MPRRLKAKAPHKLAIAGVAALIWLVVIASELLVIRELSAATAPAVPAANSASSQEGMAWKA
ncbi:MAG TPA: hypothetical protein VMA09_20400 [Candidatus Binataceae bacterium]|nr:hypothetical protein [Candidatus Binataceae bacterium]